ncbi:hypothetical protein MKZ38_008668 [Zalerion maritima]|uniref:F-box domain-containing protein n=1 Tax=Zalerion maritima TaxID=339359 RepID=A0AAD5RHS9_9PEZI|nr:hypothetical protein MKZ38_008668 [Zalerion maritima]
MGSTPDDQLKSELESFRRKWLSEVRSKHPAGDVAASSSTTPKSSKVPGKRPIPRHLEDDHDYVQPQAFEDEGPTAGHADAVHRLYYVGKGKDKGKEPVSALDHYEAAVEKESQGTLGDSLKLYRKAFRMDSHVDKKYKEKYFPKNSKPHKPNPSNASPTVPNTAHHSSAAGGGEVKTTSDLIASFAELSITGAPAPIEGMPEPPCPIADIPDEVLSHIFWDVALTDLRDFVRLAQVCKRFAYVVATDAPTWRAICQGPEFGFPGMHHDFAYTVQWEPLPAQDEFTFDHEKGVVVDIALEKPRREARRQAMTHVLLEKSYAGSWKSMFRNRPRVRFGGAYISTVNYWRTGHAGPNQTTWGSPMVVVTYYRYLRFFRDGTLMSLLTTHSPAEVVPHFTLENYRLHSGGGAPHLPSSVVSETYRGVWKMGSSWGYDSSSGSEEDARTKEDGITEAEEEEANISIQTEGVSKYIFEMELVMRSAGRVKGLGARNNKLVWRSHSSYNTLTDDKADFPQKNDKPFFFSRVASYGVGE